MTVTVVTSTIGRPELNRCIESVRTQAYPCRHMIFVNGPRYHDAARSLLQQYPEVFAGYLPEETGDYGMGGSMADVFAAAPFLTRSDWIFYLDDDNFFDPNHVESVMRFATENALEWAYSLRRFVDKAGNAVCDDDWSSLGHWPIHGTDQHVVDNSCYAVSRRLAQRFATAWTAMPYIADRCFYMALKESGAKHGCTGLSTVNYRTGTGTAPDNAALYLRSAEIARAAKPDGFPWRVPTVF